ncbi:M20/M25/M40 family metallo-hydrolase [Sphingomonas xanthus]|uniref:Carboxypeptidase Q n=1 Tax=Sphingomonas xanthus TaxID=2594473 RepID=A0A516ITD4_9SPHN|nr:M20/M25/M40 family metallo-hydrolase [Sphingomonas xanthus]QDP20153.1 M20/M25/M40 family metallo-hydrolase [Sphingomonas xanthus]
MTFRVQQGLLLAAATVALGAPARANDIARVIDEGMNRSQVMATAHELVDGIGARLTNSTGMRRAEKWAEHKMQSYGLSDVRREGFEFGRGWDLIDSEVRMVAPRPIKLTAIPVAWTPPTDGTLRAEVVMAPISERRHFAAYRGKLRGKIVLISLPGDGSEPTEPYFRRHDSAGLGKLDEYRQPEHSHDSLEERLKRNKYAADLDNFLASEGALAWARISYRDGKLVHGAGYSHHVGTTPKLPGIEIAAEDYRRLARFAKNGPAPVLEIRSDVRFLDQDSQAYNIIGEIPGSDPQAGYVMAGAHLDSWAAADGAVDNGAGSAVVLEAARILKTLGVRPKRTIRFALWGAEEQGLYGSLAYIERHIASRPVPSGTPAAQRVSYWREGWPIAKKAGYGQLKAYFNMDNGSGKLRGVYAEGNHGAVPLLKEWMSPFASMGATAVVAAPTGGTDHVYMQAVGVPGFQFVQDPLDYGSRLHHSSIDTFDHMKAADLRQASVVMAGMLLAAANSEKELPRPPLPTQPLPTDPFDYQFPKDE